MMEIKGETIVFTDIHFGHKKDVKNWLGVCVDVVKYIAKYAKENNIKNFIHCGDFFDNRPNVNVQTMNIATSCLNLLSKIGSVHMIIGNHDTFNDKSTDINSLVMFSSYRNVHVYSKSEEVEINGHRCLFMPWLSTASEYEKNSYDALFGHFDTDPRYFSDKSFVDSNTNMSKTDDDVMKELLELDDKTIEPVKTKETITDFIDLVHEGGVIFSGHIHQHKEFTTRGIKWIYVGSPYQQTYNEMDSVDGFYVIHADGSYDFHEIPGTPKFMKVKMSDIVKNGVESYDFSRLTNNVVTKIYDIDVDGMTEAKIKTIFDGSGVFSEPSPVYEVSVVENNPEVKESLEALSKSKDEYLKNFINNIPQENLDARGVNREELTEMLIRTYDSIVRK